MIEGVFEGVGSREMGRDGSRDNKVWQRWGAPHEVAVVRHVFIGSEVYKLKNTDLRIYILVPRLRDQLPVCHHMK